MDDVSQTFAWGTALACAGLIALVVLAVVWVLVRQLVAMAARLQPVTATVREEEGALVGLAREIAGPAIPTPLRYDYEVDGRRYSGSRPTLQIGRADQAAAQAALAAHHPGETITVFYDRDHPGRSVMDKQPPAVPAWCRIGVPVAAVVVVVGIVLMAIG